MIRPILVTLFLAVPLAACGSDDTTEQVSSTAASATTAAPTGDTPTSSTDRPVQTATPLEVPPCSLLTADDVSTVTGLTAAEGEEDGPISCRFDLMNAGASIFVAVDDGEGRIAGPASLYDAYLSASGEVVAGVGDSAVYSSTFRAIAVDAGGGHFYAVGVNGGYPPELGETKDPLIALATLALDRL